MIVITTPTGTIGRQVLQTLLAGGQTVRVIAREPSRLGELQDRVEVVLGSHNDPAVLDKALDGAESLFWLVPADRKAPSVHAAYVDFARPACEVFQRHGIRHVVGISALGRGFPEDAGHVTATLAMDDLIAASGVAYRAVTCPSFMDNTLRQIASIQTQGLLTSPTPATLKAPTCATRDIAAVASRLLVDASWTGYGSVSVLGPEDLSFLEMAEILSDVLGRPVRYQQTLEDEFRANLVRYGYSEAMAQAMVAMMRAKNEGLDHLEVRTAENTSPTTFRQWCQEVLVPALGQ